MGDRTDTHRIAPGDLQRQIPRRASGQDHRVGGAAQFVKRQPGTDIDVAEISDAAIAQNGIDIARDLSQALRSRRRAVPQQGVGQSRPVDEIDRHVQPRYPREAQR